jgi:ABC-type sulfate transport system permease subunit
VTTIAAPVASTPSSTVPSPPPKREGTWRRFFVRIGLRTFVLVYLGMLVAVPVGSIAYKAFAPGFTTAWSDTRSCSLSSLQQ